MRVRLHTCIIAVLVGVFSLASADDMQTHVTYVCNGEHLFIESCNVRDLSDNSTCMVAHPDKMRPNGFPTYTNETRGTLKKLLPTCQQPSAQSLAKAQAEQQKNAGEYQPVVNPPKLVAPASAPQAIAVGSAMNFGSAGLSGDSLREGRCVVSG